MKRYLSSFDDDAMTFPEEDGPAVAEAAHAVSREATDAGLDAALGDFRRRSRQPDLRLVRRERINGRRRTPARPAACVPEPRSRS
jgi:hypothetical protein